jgi:hypothetical protein
MTAPTPTTSPARSLPTPFVACLLYALRVCVPPKKWALLALPLVGSTLFGLLARVIEEHDSDAERLAVIAGGALFSLVLPLACLVVGDAVLGAEVRSGAFALTWLSPASFSTIVLARWLAGWIVATVSLAPAMAIAAFAAGVPDAAAPLVVAAVAAAGAYVAVFVLIGATVQRAALWSLAIVLLGERLLGAALSGIAQLSPQWLAAGVYADLGPDGDELLRDGVPSGVGALLRLAIVGGVALAFAVRRVRKLKLIGTDD